MPCTTILIGKKASYDKTTLMARNEDSGYNTFDPKKWIVVTPDKQPKHYKSVLSSFEIDLPDCPMRYTAMPNAIEDEGIWAEAGFNEKNVAMSATETITSNPRVLGADPLVLSGIGEEDMLTLVLPYISSAREGVLRLGSMLEKYGTYEMNGIGFQDEDEIWWLETIGGHHWIAKKVPDNCYVVMPNQQGIDFFDMIDAYNKQKEHMCSVDLISFIEDNNLDVCFDETPVSQRANLNTRAIFGSHRDYDHLYNTPRAWYMEKILNPSTIQDPESDTLPWSMTPEKKVTIEDIKYILSSYYQGTPYNIYAHNSDKNYRPIGINRNNFVAITQIRKHVPAELKTVEWIAMGCNAFNGMTPFYANVTDTPAYLKDTNGRVTTESFYWANRLIGALVDAHYASCMVYIDKYKQETLASGHAFLKHVDQKYMKEKPEDVQKYLEMCNNKMADHLKELTLNLLNDVLRISSLEMKNRFSRSDA